MVRYLNVHLAQIWIMDRSDNKLHLRASAGAMYRQSPAKPIR